MDTTVLAKTRPTCAPLSPSTLWWAPQRESVDGVGDCATPAARLPLLASRCSPSAPPFPRQQISYHSSTPLVMQNGESILLNNPCMSVTGGERAPFVFGEVIVDSEA